MLGSISRLTMGKSGPSCTRSDRLRLSDGCDLASRTDKLNTILAAHPNRTQRHLSSRNSPSRVELLYDRPARRCVRESFPVDRRLPFRYHLCSAFECCRYAVMTVGLSVLQRAERHIRDRSLLLGGCVCSIRSCIVEVERKERDMRFQRPFSLELRYED